MRIYVENEFLSVIIHNKNIKISRTLYEYIKNDMVEVF